MNAATPAIDLRQVSFRWPGASGPCLEIESFDLADRERLFLHGPSGSGKTTLLSLVGGVLEPQRGSVTVHGQPLAALAAGARDRFRADRIGFIFQLFNLIPYLSARDNILLACRFSPARRQRLHQAGTSPGEEARRLAARLDLEPDLLQRPAAALSVGQQQRVAAARALIGWPALVIADEPLLAVLPGATLQELWGLIGVAEKALLVVSALVVLVGLAGLVAVVVAGLGERRRELAILRSLGASPRLLFLLLALESIILSLLGSLLGLALLYGSTALAGPWLEAQYGLAVGLGWPSASEWALLGAVLAAALLASLVPAWRAYRYSLADGMTIRV